jgi:hypothetical protein
MAWCGSVPDVVTGRLIRTALRLHTYSGDESSPRVKEAATWQKAKRRTPGGPDGG